MKENELQRLVRLELGQKPDLVLWRNETGAYAEACTVNWLRELSVVIADDATVSLTAARIMIREALRCVQWVRYGLCVGSSDLIGVLKPSGRFFALELKADKGKTTEEQELFIKLVNNMGGYAGVARSVDEALQHYERAKHG